jgi:arylsulfatase A-like enzyme
LSTLKSAIWLLSAVCSLVLMGITSVHAEEPVDKPNLIFIFSDDQRWDAIGYANPLVHTPNLDRLSSKGIRFNQAVIALPVCSPARAAAVTGRYAMANGVTDYSKPLKESEVSFATYLNRAGYMTAMVGKWHIPGRSARDLEFQEIRELGAMAPYLNPIVLEYGIVHHYVGFSTDYLAEQTIQLIEKSKSEGKPFGIWLCPQAPHGRSVEKGGNWHSQESARHYNDRIMSDMPVPPHINDDLSGKPPYLKDYRGRRKIMSKGPMTAKRYRDERAECFGLITEMDRSLGKLFSKLEELGVSDNTYIVFMSDNGIFRGDHGFMSKALHYEESLRVPLFIVGPGIASGYDDSLVSNVDIAPTLLDLAGIDIPENMHGKSLKATLLENIPLERSFVLCELPDANNILETCAAYSLRSQRWKYIQTFEEGNDKPYTYEELYDLKVDPFEMNNLSNHPGQQGYLKQLRVELDAQRQQYQQ